MSGTSERITTYPVRDAGGRLVAYHVREDKHNDKQVRWKLPDGTWGLNGTPLADLPLYGAELVSNLGEDELIVLTEGEKARDALEAVGIPAVGTVTGASGTPGAEALEVLRGCRVALWADNDDAGRAHMQRIAETLHDVAAEVLVYTWDEAPEKGDAADHPTVQSRNPKAVDRLLTDLEGSPRWKPTSVASEDPVARSGEPDKYGRGGESATRKSARNLPFKSAREIAETAPEEVPWTSPGPGRPGEPLPRSRDRSSRRGRRRS